MASKWTAPSGKPDARDIELWGTDKATQYAESDQRSAVRQRLADLTEFLAKARKEIETLERSDAAFAVRSTYYGSLGSAYRRAGAAMKRLADLYEQFPDADRY